jgi:arabinofuranosyltransferase
MRYHFVMTRQNRPLFYFLFAVTLAVLFRTAWAGDDSFITMRSIDNWVHGYGLTWNPIERVQTFTHPLWMLLLTPFYILIGNAYLTLIAVSLLVSACVVILFLGFGARDEWTVMTGWVILVLSKAFMDYSTSGLENPLSHLLTLGFFILFLRWENPLSRKQIFILAALAGLGVLNRMDALLFFLPQLIYILWREKKFNNVWLMLSGFAPFILWEIFSIIYYGFPFPNTYYAKLNAGIPERIMVKQGLLYFMGSIILDPLTVIAILASFLTSVFGGDIKQRLSTAGIAMYLAYVIYIGGDFMSGRFFSTALLLSVFLLLQYLQGVSMQVKVAVIAVSVAVVIFLPSPNTFDYNDRYYETTGIVDERAWWYSATNLTQWSRQTELPAHTLVSRGKQIRAGGDKVHIEKSIGFLGYYAGPEAYVVDFFALSDPLLARMPVQLIDSKRIGHFRRPLPNGYRRTLDTGEIHLQDKNLSLYCERLWLIIRSPLWSAERWEAIWKMNTGQYNYLLK